MEAGGRSLLSRIVGLCAARGLRDFTLVLGYRADMIQRALSAEFPGLSLRYIVNERFEETNNAYSLALARPGAPEPVLILDSDLVFEGGVLDRMFASPRPNRLALRSGGTLGAEEVKAVLGPGGTVAALGKDLPAERSAGESVGLEVFSAPAAARLFDILERRVFREGMENEFYEASMQELIREGTEVHPVDLGGLFCMEVDTPEDLEGARRALAAL